MYVKCPHCQSTFRLTQEKMAAREGLVRCGACREVFNAQWNLVDSPEAVALDNVISVRNQVPITAQSVKNTKTTSESIQPETANENPDSESQHSTRQDQQEETERSITELPAAPRFVILDSADETPADDDLDETRLDQTEPVDPVLDGGGDHESQQVASLPERMPDDPSDDPLDEDSVSLTENRPEHSAPELLSTIEQDGPELPDRINRRIDTTDIDHGDADLDLPTQPDSQTESLFTVSGVGDYMSDRTNPLITLLWLLAAIGFIALLGLQVKTFMVDRYSQDEALRPWLSGFCKVAACELPPLRNAELFSITHTRIELHPQQPGAMRVSIKLVNEAEFEQPFPDLELTLTDRVGRIVGRRTFTAAGYLGSSQADTIASGGLGEIVFDLARPHEKAVGFVVDVVLN